jgi:anti-anti-sigma regulatory factor
LVSAIDASLTVAAPSRQVQSILEATGLTRVMSIYRLEADAVQACVRPGLQSAG